MGTSSSIVYAAYSEDPVYVFVVEYRLDPFLVTETILLPVKLVHTSEWHTFSNLPHLCFEVSGYLSSQVHYTGITCNRQYSQKWTIHRNASLLKRFVLIIVY